MCLRNPSRRRCWRNLKKMRRELWWGFMDGAIYALVACILLALLISAMHDCIPPKDAVLLTNATTTTQDHLRGET